MPRAAGISWLVTVVMLLVATLYNVLTEGELGVAGIILSVSMVVYFVARLILRRRSAGGQGRNVQEG